jgi:hypothetical protein
MFEIGSSLREARERRGLSFADVERGTRIRPRYLRALEEETFDQLPGRVYAKGFLRGYADFLGLDGQRFVDELSSRLAPEDVDAHVPLQPIARRRFRIPAVVVGGLVLAAVVVGLVAWLAGSPQCESPGRPRSPHPVATPVRHPPPPAPPKPRLARLRLTASSGACWFEARLGSQAGRLLQTGTLATGQSLSVRGRRLWIRLGDPTVLAATLNGRRVALPQTTPVDLVVTGSGVRAA